MLKARKKRKKTFLSKMSLIYVIALVFFGSALIFYAGVSYKKHSERLEFDRQKFEQNNKEKTLERLHDEQVELSRLKLEELSKTQEIETQKEESRYVKNCFDIAVDNYIREKQAILDVYNKNNEKYDCENSDSSDCSALREAVTNNVQKMEDKYFQERSLCR